jgi:hypothetical protein
VDTYVVKFEGVEVARISGESIVPCKKSQTVKDSYQTEMVEDKKLLKLVSGEKTILVLYVSGSNEVTVEKVSE